MKSILILIILFCAKTNADDFSDLNTEYFELAPIIEPDGRKMWFTIEGHPLNTNYKNDPYAQDIWFSTNENGKWSKPIHGGDIINNSGYNRVISISADGRTLYLSGKYLEEGWDPNGISVSYKRNGNWTRPKSINIVEFKNYSNYIDYLIDSDQKYLFISSISHDCMGGRDLYLSKKLNDTLWSSPINIESLNTKKEEFSPYLAPDNKTLYFASERVDGIGGADIWVSKRLDNSFLKWSDPINLGPNINTVSWDAYFSIKANSNEAILVRIVDENTGNTDIISKSLIDSVKPERVVILSGFVLDEKDQKGIVADLIIEDLETGTVLHSVKSDIESGEFKVIINENKKVGISANKERYYSQSLNIEIEGSENEIKQNILMKKIEVGQTIRLNNIFFKTGESELLKESFAELNRVKKLLDENPKMKILIKGHTDNVGTKNNNLILSQNRARSVAEFLTNSGIEVSRVSFEGFGEDKPMSENTSEEGRALNRRVEFEILEN